MHKKKLLKAAVLVPLAAFVAYLFLWYVVGFAGPPKVEQFVDIAENETAFLIDLESDTQTDQVKFDSVQSLEAHKVSAKRVSLPLRKKRTGRRPGQFEWVPTAAVIKVDRSPETRLWTESPKTGTSAKDDALYLESKEPVKFYCGATITCSVLEEDTAVFLYHYGTKNLSEIIDTTVRGFCQQALARDFRALTLDEARVKKDDIFEKAEKEAQEFFKARGLTVHYFGNHGGLAYANPAVQESIDKSLIQQVERQIAEQENLAQDVRNQTAVAKAVAERQAAEQLLGSRDAVEMKTRLEILLTQAEARKAAAGRWKGQLPTMILPAGGNTPVLLQLPPPK
jgi:hypothetical protein